MKELEDREEVSQEEEVMLRTAIASDATALHNSSEPETGSDAAVAAKSTTQSSSVLRLPTNQKIEKEATYQSVRSGSVCGRSVCGRSACAPNPPLTRANRLPSLQSADCKLGSFP